MSKKFKLFSFYDANIIGLMSGKNQLTIKIESCFIHIQSIKVNLRFCSLVNCEQVLVDDEVEIHLGLLQA